MKLTEKERSEVKKALLVIVRAGAELAASDGDKEAAVHAAELLIKP